MPQALEQVLQRTELYCDYCDYKLVRLPANGITIAAGVLAEASVPFTALVVDKDEVTLMLPDDVCQAFATRLRLGNRGRSELSIDHIRCCARTGSGRLYREDQQVPG